MPRRCGVVARRPDAVASAVLVALLLAGCSVLSDGDAVTPSRLPVDGAGAGGTSFPNLGSIPDAPPRASSAEERQAVVEELRNDRANAAGGAGTPADPAPDPAPGPASGEGVDAFAD